MYRPKTLDPVRDETLELISPEDRDEVSEFDREYGAELREALKRPRTIKSSKMHV